MERFFYSIRNCTGKKQKGEILNFAKESNMISFLFCEYLWNPQEIDFLDFIYSKKREVRDMILALIYDSLEQGLFSPLQNPANQIPLSEL